MLQRQAEADEGSQNDQAEPSEDLPEGLEEDGSILPKSLAPGGSTAYGIGASALGGRAGDPLPATARAFMEPRFGYDFSSVRIHTDSDAARLAKSIHAAAFTHGRHIFFGAGRFDQRSEPGRRLLAHELTHVIQHGGGDGASAPASVDRSVLGRPEIHAARGPSHQVWRAVEAHVNLREPQRVRIYQTGRSAQDFETSAGTGTRTSRLIRRAPYPILDKRIPPTAKVGRWGLQYFAWFTAGGVGFHSNICYPRPHRRRTLLTVDGTPHSHGCMRLHHGDSQIVYNALSVDDSVYVYNRTAFRPASWSAGASP